MQNQERRRYFRIDDQALINTKAIDQIQKQQRVLKFEAGFDFYPDNQRLYLTLEQDFAKILNNLSKSSPEITNALQILNRKINLIAKGGPEKNLNTVFDTEPAWVNLSASGIAFNCSDNYKVGQNLEIELVLLPDEIYIFALGEIVEVQKEQDTFRISADFSLIRDDDLERLVGHIMRKESELLRKKRQDRLSGS